MITLKILIGIDPDCKKSGFAAYRPSDKNLTVDAVAFFELFNKLTDLILHYPFVPFPIKVYIEAGWLIKKSNFHGKAGQTKSVGEMIAKKVGANHETGRKIVEMCEYLEIEYVLVEPMGKITPEMFEKITGIKLKKKDQDMIDAAMLVWGRNN